MGDKVKLIRKRARCNYNLFASISLVIRIARNLQQRGLVSIREREHVMEFALANIVGEPNYENGGDDFLLDNGDHSIQRPRTFDERIWKSRLEKDENFQKSEKSNRVSTVNKMYILLR